MKNLILIAFFTVFGIMQMLSQKSFSPGIKGGINISNLSSERGTFDNGGDTYRSFSSKTNFYLGGFFDMKLSKIYTLSPELLFSNQGAGTNVAASGNINVSYLNINIVNKFTFAKGFYPFLGTSFDVVVDKNYKIDSEFDVALFVGAGISFTKNFGIEARIQKGLIPVLDYSDGNHNNIVFQFGATYTFDLK